MKVLVLSADYPNLQGQKNLMYVHKRNCCYISNGIDVTVLNFKTKTDYDIDGVTVISKKSFSKSIADQFDVLICHAANIRNHYLFLKKNQKYFKRIIFIFHGHEVIPARDYPKPYDYMPRSSFIARLLLGLYDWVKLKLWEKYLPKLAYKSNFVFVSEWMRQKFFQWTGITPQQISGKDIIIYNAIGKVFEEQNYDDKSEKEYDFITIRGNLDGSKYAIDFVNNIAKNNPDLSFLVIGKGDFFKHVRKADNIEWKNTTLKHEEMLRFLDISKCGLMPTRFDAQGLMACEFAGYGIPLITSDISVCVEVFRNMKNVALVSDDYNEINLPDVLNSLLLNKSKEKDERYFAKNTTIKEVDLIKAQSPNGER